MLALRPEVFFDRISEHTCEFLLGKYKIYDYDNFIKGTRIPIWNGAFGKNKERDLSKFVKLYKKFAPLTLRQLSVYRIFVIPITDGRVAERVEGAMYELLKNSNNDKARDFIDNEVRYKIKAPKEKPMKAKINLQNIFLGLPDEFLI